MGDTFSWIDGEEVYGGYFSGLEFSIVMDIEEVD